MLLPCCRFHGLRKVLASNEDQTKVDAQLIQVLRSAARLQFLVSSTIEAYTCK